MMSYSMECPSSSVTALLSMGTLAPACPSHAARPCNLGGVMGSHVQDPLLACLAPAALLWAGASGRPGRWSSKTPLPAFDWFYQGLALPSVTAGDFLHELTLSSFMVKIPPGIPFRNLPRSQPYPRYPRGFCTRADPESDFNREIAGDSTQI